MNPRISPSFVVAVLALVVAAGGAGYAAGTVTSSQIVDNTVQSRDIRNGTVTSIDVADRSLPRTKIRTGCASGETPLFGGCVRRRASGPSTYAAAVEDCNRRNGRLPSIAELRWLAGAEGVTWADGNGNQYEFSGEFTDDYPTTPVALDRSGNLVSNAVALSFWHHCVTS